MHKTDLVKIVAEKTGISQKKAGEVIDAVFSTIKEALEKGDSVQIVGFGTFKVKERAARKGHNPRTGEPLDIPARKAPVFQAGKYLKEAVKA